VTALERLSSSPALDPRSRYLPSTPGTGAMLGAGESLARGLHRITTEQFSVAIDALGDPSADINIATRAALTSLGRVSAMLELVRDDLGEDSYLAETAVIDETRSLLDALLGGQAELRTLDLLRGRYASVLAPEALVDVRDQLLRRHQLQRLQALAEGKALERSLHRLRRSRARFAAWPVEIGHDARIGDREPVPDRFESVGPGLGRSYRRCRKAWRSAHETGELEPDAFAGEVDVLARQLGVISSVWPEVLAATADAAARLEAALREAHGLDLLAALLDSGELELELIERSLLDALIVHERDELTSICTVLGRRVFAEPTRLFLDRLAVYWAAARP
jgi:hypothetical protein